MCEGIRIPITTDQNFNYDHRFFFLVFKMMSIFVKIAETAEI